MQSSLFNDWKKIRIIENEQKRMESIQWYMAFWRCFRIVVQIVIFLLVLCSAIYSKASLLYVTNSIARYETSPIEKSTWIWILVISYCIPHGFAFLDCLLKSIFDSHEVWPSLKIFILVLATETANVVGTTIFAFKILPKLDIIQALVLMNTVSVVPSILNLIFKSRSSTINSKFETFLSKKLKINTTSIKLKFEILLNLIAFLIQASLFFIYFMQFLNFNPNWDLYLSLGLLSLSYWENFLDVYLACFSRRKHESLSNFKRSIEFSRHKSLVLVLLCKIGCLFGFVYLYHPTAFNNAKSILSRDDGLFNEYVIVFVTHIVSSFVCYYLSLLACKLCMQQTSFALPMTLSFPILFSFVLLSCKYLPTNSALNEQFLNLTCKNGYTDGSFKWILLCGVLWWLSHLWINRHVWTNITLRTERRRRLFVRPGFSNVFIEQDLMLNRHRSLDDIFDHSTKSNSSLNEEKILLYSCATMWHENEHEMLKLLTSIMRMDKDQFERQKLQMLTSTKDPDFYDYEAHIFFDDAMIKTENGTTPNSFVLSMLSVVSEAASFCYQRKMTVAPPQKMDTPYGGRLIYTLPGGNKMIVHLKDKAKIRIKKRWSQVMYMFYLLGYFNFDDFEEIMKLYEDGEDVQMSKKQFSDFVGFGNLLKRISAKKRAKLENTYILTLDGDVDFRPEAVRLMVDKMKKHKKVGSVCGRVHPIGAGPMIWYQVFEYAVGHWLQKASEHLFGTVMCSPGCFSLLRGSSIIDDHILRTYSIKSSEASHYVQYDQGEDRWLSTLLIQQGYYIHYCSAAVSYTYAPETFDEYYSQRRRWIPSTIANLLDFLKDSKHILKANRKVSLFYVVYEFVILLASIIGPSTVLLLLIDTFQFIFGMNIFLAYFVAIGPVVVFIVFCLFSKNDTQIIVAIILSSAFGLVMIAVIIGTLTRLTNNSLVNPSSVVFAMLFVVYGSAAFLHPREFSCIIPGVLYFICLPSAFVILQLYALFNLNNVSWGTREIKTTQTDQKQPQKLKKESIREMFMKLLNRYDEHSTLTRLVSSLDSLEKAIDTQTVGSSNAVKPNEATIVLAETKCDKQPQNWIDHPLLVDSPIEIMNEREVKFFNDLIKAYLQPIVYDEAHKTQMVDSLKTLKNNCCFTFCMINALWLTMIFNLQLIQSRISKTLYITIPNLLDRNEPLVYEPLGFFFVLLFIIVLVLQYTAMLWHRYKTLLHLIYTASTNIPAKIFKKNSSNGRMIHDTIFELEPNTGIINSTYN